MLYDFTLTIDPDATTLYETGAAITATYPGKGWHTDGIDYVIPNITPDEFYDAYAASGTLSTYGVKVLSVAWVSPI